MKTPPLAAQPCCARPIEDEIAKLPQEEVSVKVIRRAVGAVTESDVMLAAASDAVILSFNVRPVGDARAAADREGVEIRHYAVIYRAIDELRSAMQGMLTPEEVEEALARPRCARSSALRGSGTIAGSHVTEGKITRGVARSAWCATAPSSTTARSRACGASTRMSASRERL